SLASWLSRSVARPGTACGCSAWHPCGWRTRMDPNKGHGENIRTYNWTEKGRRSIGRSRTAASRRPDSQNVGPNGFHFPLSGRRIRAVADLEGLRTTGFEIPADRNRHGPRNPSSTAKPNDKIAPGNI